MSPDIKRDVDSAPTGPAGGNEPMRGPHPIPKLRMVPLDVTLELAREECARWVAGEGDETILLTNLERRLRAAAIQPEPQEPKSKTAQEIVAEVARLYPDMATEYVNMKTRIQELEAELGRIKRVEEGAKAFLGRRIAGLAEELDTVKSELAAARPAVKLLASLVETEPELKDDPDVAINWDGFFVHWDEILEALAEAWPGTTPGYSESPLELVTKLIDERDEAQAALAETRKELNDARPMVPLDVLQRIQRHLDSQTMTETDAKQRRMHEAI